MHVDEAINGRQSIRAFLKNKPVTRDSIETILATAGRAPSGSNIQPWHVWVAMDAKRDEIANACQARHAQGDAGNQEYNYYPVEWREPYIGRRRNTGWGLYGHIGIEKGDKKNMSLQHGKNYDFFDAPAALFFTIDRDMELGSWIDCGMFIQSVMLAARGLGLETCAQAAFLKYHDTVMHLIGAPKEQMFVCAMSLGYADHDAAVNGYRTPRLPVNEFTVFL
ncbi:MAG: nitroreductase [Halieaceae bacterium]|jgi:nitroreductase